MTLNEIKKQALAIMFTNYDEDLADSDVLVDEITNEEYTQYLHNMNWSINRCLQRFESVNALPLEIVEYPYSQQGTDFWTKKELSNLKSVERVILEDDKQYDADIEFNMQGNYIVLKTLKKGKYVILYHPRATYISSIAVQSYDINLPDALCNLIPLFIKAELFEEDEPELASQARNIFEGMLADYLNNSNENHKQIRVQTVFSEE